MSKYAGNPKYAAQWDAYWASVDARQKAINNNMALAPCDRNVVYAVNNPNANCCPITGSPLQAPSGSLTLVVVSGSAILTWTYTDNGQDGFNIEKSLEGNFYTPIYQLPNPSSRSYSDSGVSKGHTYWYRVNAYNTIGTSSYSNTASIYFPYVLPSGPITLSVSSGSAVLNWIYTDTTQDGWYIEKSMDTTSYVRSGSSAVPSLRTWVDNDVVRGNTYWYRVQAYSAAGTSSYSNTSSIYFEDFPAAPTMLVVTSGSG